MQHVEASKPALRMALQFRSYDSCANAACKNFKTCVEWCVVRIGLTILGQGFFDINSTIVLCFTRLYCVAHALRRRWGIMIAATGVINARIVTCFARIEATLGYNDGWHWCCKFLLCIVFYTHGCHITSPWLMPLMLQIQHVYCVLLASRRRQCTMIAATGVRTSTIVLRFVCIAATWGSMIGTNDVIISTCVLCFTRIEATLGYHDGRYWCYKFNVCIVFHMLG